MNAQQRMKKMFEIQHSMQDLSLRIVDSEPFVMMKLGGKEYKYELSYQAAIEVFQKTGITIGVDSISSSLIMDVDVFPVLLVAGLRTHHEDEFADFEASKSAVLKRISMRHLNYFVAVVQAALQAVEPDSDQLAELTTAMHELVNSRNEDLDTASPLEVVPISDGSSSNALDMDLAVPTLSE